MKQINVTGLTLQFDYNQSSALTPNTEEVKREAQEKIDTINLIIGINVMGNPNLGFLDIEAHIEEASEEYITIEECIAEGTHYDSCDDDGFCNRCGEITDDDDEYNEELNCGDKCLTHDPECDGHCDHRFIKKTL